MKINRERFLLLASSIAAACNAAPRPIEAPTVIALPAPPPLDVRHDGPGDAHTDADEDAEAAPHVAGHRDGDDLDEPVDTTPNPYTGVEVQGQPCDPALNARGAPKSCASLRMPGPTCESFHDTKTECPTLTTLLKPRVAEKAIDCLLRKSGTRDICEFNISSICAYQALASACIEPSAAHVCDGILAKCGVPGGTNKVSRASCEAGVSGILPARKQRFIACMSEFCQFETCLTYL